MEKIINSFKALYQGDGVGKTHWLCALLFVLPCLCASVFQFIDKDTKSLLIPLLIAGTVLLILSIIPMFMLSGFYVKFLNKRLTDSVGLPKINLDCLYKGLKFFPIGLVWCIYIGIPCLIYLGLVIGIFALSISGNPSPITAIGSVFGMFCLLFLLMIPLFIICPFLSFISMKFSENFEYSAELFNPLTPFRYMRIAFKDTILVALKFFVVYMVTSFAAQIIIFIGVLFMFVFGFVFAIMASPEADLANMPGFVITVIVFSALIGLIPAYVQWVTQLAYADNLEEVYREKIAG